MNFFDLIERRYSVRGYKSDPVEKTKLEKVLEAAWLAPSAANRQPFQFLVIETKDKQEELLRIYDRHWFVQAPLIICACVIPSKAWSRFDGKNYGEVDTTIAMDHLILAAAELGLGTCWIAAFNPVSAREILNLPEDIEPVAFTPLGYAADEPKPKKRNPMNDLIKYIQWVII